MDDNTKQEIKDSLHFKGKKGFYFEGDEKDIKLQKIINDEISKEETRRALALDRFGRDLPKASDAERGEIQLAVIKEILKAKGITDDEIAEFMRTAEEIAAEAIAEHEEHITRDFKVVKGKKTKCD